MTPTPRWFTDTKDGHSQWYIDRFRDLAAEGADLAGEARLVDAMAAPRSRILDAGCGTGGLILRLREANPAWHFAGIDFMPLACELARKRCGVGTDIREASITALPFLSEQAKKNILGHR